LAVIGEHLPQMNLVNMSTSMHRLAKFAGRGPEAHLAVVHSPVLGALRNSIRITLIDLGDKAGLHQCLSNITWSLAHMHVVDLKLLGLLSCRAISSMPGFKPIEMSTLLWAFAKLGVADSMAGDVADLFCAASQRLRESLAGFSFCCLQNIAWAFATAKQRDPALFSGLAHEMCSLTHSANCQEIGKTAWAFAIAGHRDRNLHHALAQAALLRMEHFQAREISNLLWGFAANGYWHEEVFVGSIAVVERMDLGSQQAADILWACARIMPRAMAMTYIIRLAPLCTGRLAAFKPQEVVSTVQAIANVALAEEGEEGVPSLAPRTPLHKDVLELLTAMAQWVAGRPCDLTPSSFVCVVASLVVLGARGGRPVDLILEQAVVCRAGALAATEMLSLLEAFWRSAPTARRAIRVLIAGLLSHLDSLEPRDLRAVTRLCSGVPPDATAAAGEVCTSCLALLEDQCAAGAEEQPCEPDAEEHEEVHPEAAESSCDSASCADSAHFGSEFGVQALVSLRL